MAIEGTNFTHQMTVNSVCLAILVDGVYPVASAALMPNTQEKQDLFIQKEESKENSLTSRHFSREKIVSLRTHGKIDISLANFGCDICGSVK